MMLWKLLFTGMLCAAALTLAVSRQASAYWLALAAVVLSWFGDATLAGFKPLTRAMSQPSLWGLGFFAVAHLCYILAFTMYLKAWARPGWRTPAMIAAFTVAAVALWLLICSGGTQPAPMRAAALVYTLVLMMMACIAWVSAMRRGGFVWPPALGSVLFIISDGMIAMEWFRGWSLPWQDAAVWATYAPAQLLLVIGFWMLKMPEAASALASAGM
ncbi:MAG: lysoplasmalogenase [Oscillospiraceae bacterium]|jgi:uncharacterized membrane protein YhhN|nr:lysoplasmalogenase [Oscillospiraceae bacterium]